MKYRVIDKTAGRKTGLISAQSVVKLARRGAISADSIVMDEAKKATPLERFVDLVSGQIAKTDSQTKQPPPLVDVNPSERLPRDSNGTAESSPEAELADRSPGKRRIVPSLPTMLCCVASLGAGICLGSLFRTSDDVAAAQMKDSVAKVEPVSERTNSPSMPLNASAEAKFAVATAAFKTWLADLKNDAPSKDDNGKVLFEARRDFKDELRVLYKSESRLDELSHELSKWEDKWQEAGHTTSLFENFSIDRTGKNLRWLVDAVFEYGLDGEVVGNTFVWNSEKYRMIVICDRHRVLKTYVVNQFWYPKDQLEVKDEDLRKMRDSLCAMVADQIAAKNEFEAYSAKGQLPPAAVQERFLADTGPRINLFHRYVEALEYKFRNETDWEVLSDKVEEWISPYELAAGKPLFSTVDTFRRLRDLTGEPLVRGMSQYGVDAEVEILGSDSEADRGFVSWKGQNGRIDAYHRNGIFTDWEYKPKGESERRRERLGL